MFRSQAIRTVQSARVASRAARRTYATTPPPPPSGQPAPNPLKAQNEGGSNALLYTGLAIAVGAGGYYVFRSGDESAADIKAARDEERIKAGARETADAVKDRAGDAVDQGRVRVDRAAYKTEKEYEAAKAKAREAADAAKDKAHDSYDAVKDRAKGAYDTLRNVPGEARRKVDESQRAIEETNRKGLFDRAEESIDSAKRSTQETLNQARNSTEHVYRDVRDTAERKAAEIRDEADRKGEQVKEGWFSWLGWGKSKVNNAEAAARERELQAERHLEDLKKRGAKQVAYAAEDVRERAEKHT